MKRSINLIKDESFIVEMHTRLVLKKIPYQKIGLGQSSEYILISQKIGLSFSIKVGPTRYINELGFGFLVSDFPRWRYRISNERTQYTPIRTK